MPHTMSIVAHPGRRPFGNLGPTSQPATLLEPVRIGDEASVRRTTDGSRVNPFEHTGWATSDHLLLRPHQRA